MANKPNIKTPQFVRDNPLAAATLSKLNKSSMSGLNGNTLESLTLELPNIADSVNEKIKNNESVLELFPDIELAIQIIVSSIISPNDMLSTNSIYVSPNIKLPPDVTNALTDTIKKHINVNYNLDDNLYDIVKETMFTKGATAFAIIPEASLDDVINPDYNGQISIESINNHYTKTSILGKTDSITCSVEELRTRDKTKHLSLNILSKESVTDKTKTIEVNENTLGIQIIDNPSILKVGNSRFNNIKKRAASKIKGYGISREDIGTEEDLSELDALFKNNDRLPMATINSINTIDTASRESIGMPMTFKLPIESVIPVYALNDVSKHLGYFVLLDENGLPLDIRDDVAKANNANLIQTTGNIENAKSTMIDRAKSALYGITKVDATIDNMEDIYGELVENLIKQKLKNGDYEEIADIKSNADIYRVMFFRTLRAQTTKLLFLPSELVAYYAFEYRDNGTGKSLLEKNAILFSIRGILLFATLMGNIKNSITTTEVTADIDEQIADPEKIMQTIISEVMKTREQQLPIGVTKINDLVDWIHREGFKFKFTHPGLPKIDIDTSDSAPSKIIPDDTLDQNIRDRQYMSFGLTPEIVASGTADAFATSVVAKNLLFAKRMAAKQKQLNVMRTDHVRKIIKSDMDLQNKMYNIIEANLKEIMKYAKNKKLSESEDAATVNDVKKSEVVDYIISIFADEIVVELPEAQQTEANHINEAFRTYKDTLSEYIDAILSSQAIPSEMLGNIGTNLDQFKELIKGIYLRKWMTDNGYLPEISEFFTLRDDGKPMFDALGDFESFYNIMSESIINFTKKHNKTVEKINKKLEKLSTPDGGGSSYSSDSSDDGEDQNENNQDQNEENTGEESGGDNGDTGDTGGEEKDTPKNDEDEGEDLMKQLESAGSEDEGKEDKEEKEDNKEEKKEDSKPEDK